MGSGPNLGLFAIALFIHRSLWYLCVNPEVLVRVSLPDVFTTVLLVVFIELLLLIAGVPEEFICGGRSSLGSG